MRPLIVDTNVWIDWLRGKNVELRELSRDRILFMPSIVAMELLSGAKDRKSYKTVIELINSFDRHKRILVHTKEDYLMAGEALADLGWPASRKSNDALVISTARRMGAEVLTKDQSDFKQLAALVSVSLSS